MSSSEVGALPGSSDRSADVRSRSVRVWIEGGTTELIEIIRQTKFLAVHFAFNTPQHVPGRKYFTITHKPTGRAVLRRFENAEAAIAAMERISCLDWNFDEVQECPRENKRFVQVAFEAHK